MNVMRYLWVLVASILSNACAPLAGTPPIVPDARAIIPSFAEHQAQCLDKEGWSDPAPPVRIFGNVFNVGTCGISVILITGPDGHILIDGAAADAAPLIAQNIERLGYQLHDVKILLSSHEHMDHSGGLAELQRLTNAKMMAMPAAAPVLASGAASADDPQLNVLSPFPPVQVNHILHDGERVRLGPLHLTAHMTPGHSPGSTSWSWQSCHKKTCHAVVYADSLSAYSSDEYRFSDHPAYVAKFRESIAKLARLKCSLIITPHPSASDLYERLAGTKPLVSKNACRDYATAYGANLDQRLASEVR